MGYLFLLIALFAGVTKGYCGKKTSFAVVSSSESMVVNALRMVLCVVIGFALLLLNGKVSLLNVDLTTLLISMLSGFASAAFVVSWLLSVKSGAYMMVEVFLLLGTTVAIALCRIFFAEAITPLQIAGIVLLFLSVYIMCTYNMEIKGKMKPLSLLLLFLCGFSNGIADFSQKLFIRTVPNGNITVFNFYTYVFAAISLFAVCIVFRHIEKKQGADLRAPFAILKPICFFVVIMALCLFANSFFKTQAALYLPAVRLYPLNQGAAVVLSLLMSSIIFKEKINAKCILGICISFIALLLINLDIPAILGLA